MVDIYLKLPFPGKLLNLGTKVITTAQELPAAMCSLVDVYNSYKEVKSS